jgi:hypothetical protein
MLNSSRALLDLPFVDLCSPPSPLVQRTNNENCDAQSWTLRTALDQLRKYLFTKAVLLIVYASKTSYKIMLDSD